jgi:hypothetical protein
MQKEKSNEGHASINIKPVTKDHEFIIDHIRKDDELGKLWNLMFSNSSNIISKSKTSNTSVQSTIVLKN